MTYTAPWPTAVAFEFARAANPLNDWTNRCGNFCARAYGFDASGYYTAYLQGAASNLHQGVAPVGALHFWDGGAGHVAIDAGGGMIWSNDLQVNGEIHLSPWQWPMTHWGKNWMGWAHPTVADTFMQAAGSNTLWTPPAAPPTPVPVHPVPGPIPAYLADPELPPTFRQMMNHHHS